MMSRFKLHRAGRVVEVTEEEYHAARAHKGLGDRIERLAKPIAKALRLSCLDEAGNLKPESGCAKRRDALNRLTTNEH